MKKIQRIILAFMLGIMPIQSALADSKSDALVDAALNGELEQVKMLIEKEGVDINAKESEIGATALLVASVKGHLEIVQYLINKGADINAKGDKVVTALMGASAAGHLAVVKALVEGKKGLLSMFSKGADINAKDNDGITALMGASMKGHLEVVKYLINKGVDVNAVASIEIKGVVLYRTALDVAKIGKHHKIAEVLKNAGAKTAKEIQK